MNRSFIAAIAAAATAAVIIVVTPTGKGVPENTEYVVPDCADDVTPVDCLFDGPYNAKDPGTPIWRGCNQGLAAHAHGTQCIATPSTIRSGSTVRKARGAMREFSKADVELAEPTLPDGGKVR